MDGYWNNQLDLQNVDDKSCEVSADLQGDYVIRGRLKPHQPPDAKIRFWAANPIDRRDSFVGSGLAFPNPEIAFENTPNLGVTKAIDGHYSFKIFTPNSFYVDLGRTLLPPHVLIKICGTDDEIEAIVIDSQTQFPDRLLTNAEQNYTRANFKPRTWNISDLKRFSATME